MSWISLSIHGHSTESSNKDHLKNLLVYHLIYLSHPLHDLCGNFLLLFLLYLKSREKSDCQNSSLCILTILACSEIESLFCICKRTKMVYTWFMGRCWIYLWLCSQTFNQVIKSLFSLNTVFNNVSPIFFPAISSFWSVTFNHVMVQQCKMQVLIMSFPI